MPSTYILGKDGHLYVSATPVESAEQSAYETAAGSATEIAQAQDVSTNLTKDVVEISSRANDGWKQEVGTLKNGRVTFSIVHSPGDEGEEILRDAFLSDEEIFCAVLSHEEDDNDAEGIAGNFNVIGFTRNEPIGGVFTIDVELAPSSNTGWFEGGS